MLKKFLILLLPFSVLFSEEDDPYLMSDYGGEPSGIVEGCVNVITGDYVVRRDDFVVKGHEPIRIPLNYSPRDVQRTNYIYGGWNFAENFLVAKLDNRDTLYIYEKSGVCLQYFYDPSLVEKGKITPCPFNLRKIAGGWTNTALGDISARYNPLNNVVYSKPKDVKEIIVEAPDGSVRYYRTKTSWRDVRAKASNRDSVIDFLLYAEVLPTGNVISYQWEKLEKKRWRVKRIESKSLSGKVYAWVDIDYDPGDDKHRKGLMFRTSDGRSVHYTFDSNYKLNGRRISLLKNAEYSFKPSIQYHYWQSEKSDIYPELLESAQGRKMHLKYYKVGPNDEAKVHIQKKHPLNDAKYTRVQALYQPLGETSDMHRSHLFRYSPGKYKKGNGSTDVLDAQLNLTRYDYNRNFVLTTIERFLGDRTLFSKEVFGWTDKNWLENKSLMGQDKKTLFSYSYRYDEYGNIKDETHFGVLKGEADVQDACKITRSYYGNHLLKSETFPSGKVIEYFYVGNSNLLSAKFERDTNRLMQRRTFYSYNETKLACEISDNGTGQSWEDMTGVTQRLVKHITPNAGDFMYGMPHVIEERYLENGQEILLRKQIIHYDQGALGNVSRIEYYDADGEYQYTLNYQYDERDRLVAQTDPLGRKRKIDYDANHNPILDYDPNENFVLTKSYDFMNRPIIVKQSPPEGEGREIINHYNNLGQKVREVDFRGNVTHQEYNPFGHPTKTILPDMLTAKGKQTPQIERTFNALGKPLKEKDPEGYITQTWYTARGKPYRILHSDGTEERLTYDISGYQLKSHTSPEGVRTEYAYDVFDRVIEKRILSIEGEVLSQENFTYDAFKLLSKTDPDGVVTAYSYDGAGRKIREVVLDRVTTYEYDSLGRMYRVTRYNGNYPEQVLIKEYDLLDRVVEERQEDGEGLIYSFTTYSYDDFSNKIAVTKEVKVGDVVERFFYDPFRRLVKRIDALGHVTTIDYNDYFINELDQKVLCKITTDPMGNKTIETFDVFGNLVSLEKQNNLGKALLQEAFFYNLNQQKTKQISTLFDPDKKIIKAWSYDSRSRLTELKEAVGEPIEKVTQFAYTRDGHLQTITKPDGTTISYTYDGLGRQTSIQTSDNSCHYALKYDTMGHVIESNDLIQNKTTVRTYNHFGELLAETQANKQTLQKTYDQLGRKTALIFANGSKVLYDYTPYHLAKVERISSNGTSLYAHYYTEYDLSFNLMEELLLSKEPLYHTVDLLSRRIETDSPYSNEQITSIDPCGNVRSYKRTLEGAIETSQFDYDDLHQLTQETGFFNHNYAYDAHHNRLQKDTSIYEVNALHELESTSETTYQHDLNGNRISSTKNHEDIRYTYDGLDRLVQICSGNLAVRFSYDSWNRCQTMHHLRLYEGVWTLAYIQDILYDEQNELGCFPRQLRILGQGKGAEIGATIAIEQDRHVYVPIHDLFGNIIALLDPKTHEIRESYRYTVFGEEYIFAASGSQVTDSFVHNPWRYQSKRKVGQLVAFGRRFYDPETGRWLSPDPKGFDEGPNLYQFVLNNPLVYFDLYGLSAEEGENYSVKRFVKDVAYVCSYAARSTLEDAMHLRSDICTSFVLHALKAQSNLMQGMRPSPNVGRPGFTYIGEKIHPKVEFFFLPGISNTGVDACNVGEYISKNLGGYRVGVLRNETNGIVGDLFKFAFERMGLEGGITQITRERIYHAFSENKQVVLFLNSAGAAITHNALKDISYDQRSQMMLFSFGGARTFPRDFAQVTANYISNNDIIARTAGYFDYRKALRQQHSNVHFLDVNYANPIREHMLMEKTYREKLDQTCNFVREQYGIINAN